MTKNNKTDIINKLSKKDLVNRGEEMINEQAKKEFQKYVEQFDQMDSKIKLKIDHSYRVMEMSKKIAEKIGANVELAELIGLLHDIGRFEQLRQYQTYNDKLSFDHGDAGAEILAKDNFISKFCDEPKYYDLIITAVKNHNKYGIDEKVTDAETLEQCKIARDADKIDIMNLMRNEYTHTGETKNDLLTQKIADDVYIAALACKQCGRDNVVSHVDEWINMLAFTFDINFPASLQIIKEGKYIDDLTNIITKNKTEHARIEKVRETVNKYIDRKITESRLLSLRHQLDVSKNKVM